MPRDISKRRFERIINISVAVLSLAVGLAFVLVAGAGFLEAARLMRSSYPPHDGWVRFSLFLVVKLGLGVFLLTKGICSLFESQSSNKSLQPTASRRTTSFSDD